MRIPTTTIKWIDKKRIVKGFKFRFQKMYNSEVVVFDRNDLIRLIKDIQNKRSVGK